jgi:hypothetical protein
MTRTTNRWTRAAGASELSTKGKAQRGMNRAAASTQALGVLREGILSNWRHLFVDGEYARRERVLSGLTLEQVKRPPSEQSHSIYEELWHAARWQTISVTRDERLYETGQGGELYSTHPPEQEEEWTALVTEFLSGLEKALEWASSPEKLGVEVDTGMTMGDVLHSLAVHNAYHMGKIVADQAVDRCLAASRCEVKLD